MLPAGLAPAWVLPRAKFDLDFKRKRYWGGDVCEGGSVGSTIPPQTLINGGSVGVTDYAPDASGIVQTFKPFAPRVTLGCGLWAHQARTNVALWCRDLTSSFKGFGSAAWEFLSSRFSGT